MVSIFHVLDNVVSPKAAFGVLCLLAETVCERGHWCGLGEQSGLVDFGKVVEHSLCWTRYIWWVSQGQLSCACAKNGIEVL